jgi:uncharacterized protein
MSVELRPNGVVCNINCAYCYQNPQRQAGNVTKLYDIDLMKTALTAENRPFTLFGGEALTLPDQDLEELWSWGYDRFGSNSVQTNGILIRDEHIQMFRKYKVSVGISIDGPGELNDLRRVGSLEETRKATAKTEAAIERLCHEGMTPSLIVTLHRQNAAPAKLPSLVKWMRFIDSIGVTDVRLHILETESSAIRKAFALSDSENIAAFLQFAELEASLRSVRFDIFREIRNLLVGKDRNVSCVWRGCDPYTTAAVTGIEGNGQRSNCGRTNKEGIDFVKAQDVGFERYLALHYTSQEHGGCADCRFFLMCKGQCPGTAMDGDWRNRSEHCEVWKALFEACEIQLSAAGTPAISTQPVLRESLETQMLEAWARGSNPSLESLLDVSHKQQVCQEGR